VFSVSLNKQVFVLYTGLIASGYDLTRLEDSDPLSEVVRDIKATDWDAGALRYFSQARLQHGGVNPYWPRAAMLIHAAFHFGPPAGLPTTSEASLTQAASGRATRSDRMTRDSVPEAFRQSARDACQDPVPDTSQTPVPNTSQDPVPDAYHKDLLKAIKEFPVDRSQKGEDTVAWVMDYPKAHAALENHPAMAGLWNRYQTAMDPARLKPFEEAAAGAVSSLAQALGIQTDALPNLNVIPNPLQSPMIADFIHKDDILHAIVAVPRLTSVVHELLHEVFAKALRDARTAILNRRSLFTPELATAMVRMQYAWDGGDESWLRVFEETLVRAASIWVKYAARGAWDAGKEGSSILQDGCSGAQAEAQRDGEENTQRDGRQDMQRTEELDAWRDAEWEASLGFIYVPPILRTFVEKWHLRGPGQMESFIEDCLKACAE